MAASLISLRVVAILFGPGSRLYYGREGNTLVILLSGGGELMSDAIGSFGKIAAILSRGPLGIIALFIVLV